MELGFETIGNATVICFDKKPVLSTDPWITEQAYFGSWTHVCEIPEEQQKSIKESEFIWFSHGHPDHLNTFSLPHFQKSKILIPDHVGNRIRDDLTAQGFNVTVLKDRQWTSLSNRIRVFCIADFNQDAILLIDVGGTLIINTNDASLTGWERSVAKEAGKFKTTFLLAISGIGDADMCNFFDSDGQRVLVLPDRDSVQLGKVISRNTDRLKARYFIPFSSMHQYQRTDSIWANDYIPRLEDYAVGYSSTRSDILPPFIRYDCVRETVEQINPPPIERSLFKPEVFGDNWSDPMTESDVRRATDYFVKVEHLSNLLDFVNLRVGGRDNIIPLSKRRFDRGITFEVPRNSLMSAISGAIFDDLLIGNFMKTILVGKWKPTRLYPDFTPYLAKYADNGNARTEREISRYMAMYREREPFSYILHRFEQAGIDLIQSFLRPDSFAYATAQKVYSLLKFQQIAPK